MLRLSIRNMMLAVVALAIVFSIVAARHRASERGVEQRCKGNMWRLSLAILGHVNNETTFPPGTWPNPNLPPEARLSWNAAIASFYDYAGLYDEIDRAQAWNVGANFAVARIRLSVLECPALGSIPPGSGSPNSYIGIAGLGLDAPVLPKSDPRAGIFGYDRRTTLADIKDGTAGTMLLVETAAVRGSWLQGGPATVRGLDPAHTPYIGPGRQFGGLHRGVACAAMADGSVKMISDSISPKVFEALSTMAGGERLPP